MVAKIRSQKDLYLVPKFRNNNDIINGIRIFILILIFNILITIPQISYSDDRSMQGTIPELTESMKNISIIRKDIANILLRDQQYMDIAEISSIWVTTGNIDKIYISLKYLSSIHQINPNMIKKSYLPVYNNVINNLINMTKSNINYFGGKVDEGKYSIKNKAIKKRLNEVSNILKHTREVF